MSTLVADIALVVRLVNTARALQLIGNNMRVEGKYSTFLSPNMPAALKVAANKTQYSEQVCWHTGADAAHVCEAAILVGAVVIRPDCGAKEVGMEGVGHHIDGVAATGQLNNALPRVEVCLGLGRDVANVCDAASHPRGQPARHTLFLGPLLGSGIPTCCWRRQLAPSSWRSIMRCSQHYPM